MLTESDLLWFPGRILMNCRRSDLTSRQFFLPVPPLLTPTRNAVMITKPKQEINNNGSSSYHLVTTHQYQNQESIMFGNQTRSNWTRKATLNATMVDGCNRPLTYQGSSMVITLDILCKKMDGKANTVSRGWQSYAVKINDIWKLQILYIKEVTVRIQNFHTNPPSIWLWVTLKTIEREKWWLHYKKQLRSCVWQTPEEIII